MRYFHCLVLIISIKTYSQNSLSPSVLTGTYSFDNGMTVQVKQKNKSLYLITTGNPLQQLNKIDINRYESATIKGDSFEFSRKKDSVSLTVTNAMGKLKATKISNKVFDYTQSMDSLLPLKKKSEHFEYWYSKADTSTIDSIDAHLENSYDKILADFHIRQLPVTTVKVYPDLQSFHYAINFPHAPAELLATAFGKDEFRMVSPLKGGDDMTKFIAHEFTHCVHLNIDYSPNNPRWLWEGIAMFESGWFMDPSGIDEIKNKTYPSLQSLGNGMEYMLGYVIIEAIKDLYGFDKVVELIRNRGDVWKTLSLSQEKFEKKIFEHIHDKYVK